MDIRQLQEAAGINPDAKLVKMVCEAIATKLNLREFGYDESVEKGDTFINALVSMGVPQEKANQLYYSVEKYIDRFVSKQGDEYHPDVGEIDSFLDQEELTQEDIPVDPVEEEKSRLGADTPEHDAELSDMLKMAFGHDEEGYAAAKAKYAERYPVVDEEISEEPYSREEIIASVIKYGPDSEMLYFIDEADLQQLIDSGKVDEDVFAHWMNAKEELGHLSHGAEQEYVGDRLGGQSELDYAREVDEETEGDLQNGYGEHEVADAQDYFPNGADNPVTNHAGPGAQADNPMQKAIKDNQKDEVNEAKGIHSDLVQSYRSFIRD